MSIGIRLCLTLMLLGACGTGSASQESNPVSSIPPGAAPYETKLRQELDAALAAKGKAYVPRTHHLAEGGRPLYTNRLILEDSPYLLQHAHNPVDWYPWGPEAFARAQAEDKPIFLSIGYSTCHWCHVMERESFESEAIARQLNEHFVCIKIDRERRPDIDEIYMTAVQLQGQRGGWPMSSFLTSDGKPFYSGTYFPPDRFSVLLQRVREAWSQDRGELVAGAERLAQAVQQATAARGTARQMGEEVFGAAVQHMGERYDDVLGGFGRAPKFPNEPQLLFLLDHSLRRGDAQTLRMVTHSLDAMARGGIYDQVGGGFHRYSVDAQWLVPHFEKMLYNQAHLSRAYAQAYWLTGQPSFERTARQTLDYVLKEMTSPQGAFYSATDADSEGEEGRFFVWTPQQLQDVLAEDDAALALDIWSVEAGGNFEGHSILFLETNLEDHARRLGRPVADLISQIDRIRKALWSAREEREHPLRDDKVLTAWNGMMITALAQSSRLLDEPRYLAAAERAAMFLWQHQRREDGTLWRVSLDGSSSVPALQEDYAYLAEALVALYDAGQDRIWLERAQQITEHMIQLFWDDAAGGFFMSPAQNDPPLISRPKSPSDGAVPSGNSVALRVLAQLTRRLEDSDFSDHAQRTAAAFAEPVQRAPHGHAYMLTGLAEHLDGAVGELAYGAKGHLRAQVEDVAVRTDGLQVHLTLQLDDGWHINSNEPRQEALLASQVRLTEPAPWRLKSTEAPPAVDLDVAFEDEPLSVYSGRGTWQLHLQKAPALSEEDNAIPLLPWLGIEVDVQACDDQRCLKPETLRLEIPLPSNAGTSGDP